MSVEAFMAHVRDAEANGEDKEALKRALQARASLRAYAGVHDLALSPEDEDVILAACAQTNRGAGGHPISDEEMEEVSGGKQRVVSALGSYCPSEDNGVKAFFRDLFKSSGEGHTGGTSALS